MPRETYRTEEIIARLRLGRLLRPRARATEATESPGLTIRDVPLCLLPRVPRVSSTQ
ncbi:unnamed protein product [marine sediment metagenome]|uniref:Uncharacterized protein n=1 Tax=marine sediment metagenome TaxID=412755 RepID=X0WDT4_9ZZZZ